MSILSDLGTKVGAEFKSHRLRIEDLENGVNTVTSVNGQTGNVTLDLNSGSSYPDYYGDELGRHFITKEMGTESWKQPEIVGKEFHIRATGITIMASSPDGLVVTIDSQSANVSSYWIDCNIITYDTMNIPSTPLVSRKILSVDTANNTLTIDRPLGFTPDYATASIVAGIAVSFGDGDGSRYLSDDGTYKLIESLENVMISGVSRSTTTTNGDSLAFDLSTTNNFTANISTGGTLTFSNLAAGQSGNIVLINSGVTIAKASNVKTTSDFLTTVGVAGTFWLSYICDGTNVYVTASTKLS
jgi:hypothetical protein